MVKIPNDERIVVLKNMLNNARSIGKSLPKVELEYKNRLKNKRKGNRDLFKF